MDDDVEAKADRSVLMGGLAFVGGLAVIGMLISALAGGSGIGGLLLGAGLGILVSVGVFAGYAFSKM
ncbi:MAG: hypothetical protein AB7O78_17900 [Thermoleophilia bacterium]